MGDARCLNRFSLPELGRGLAEIVEEPGAGSKEDRHDGDDHLVEQARSEVLLGDVGAS